MSEESGFGGKIGYSRAEFGRIFQIYSQNVYKGIFRDFSFAEIGGRYFISFREEAGQIPLVTIEKRGLPLGRALFIATTPGSRGVLREIARSEKVENFVVQLAEAIDRLALRRKIVIPQIH